MEDDKLIILYCGAAHNRLCVAKAAWASVSPLLLPIVLLAFRFIIFADGVQSYAARMPWSQRAAAAAAKPPLVLLAPGFVSPTPPHAAPTLASTPPSPLPLPLPVVEVRATAAGVSAPLGVSLPTILPLALPPLPPPLGGLYGRCRHHTTSPMATPTPAPHPVISLELKLGGICRRCPHYASEAYKTRRQTSAKSPQEARQKCAAAAERTRQGLRGAGGTAFGSVPGLRADAGGGRHSIQTRSGRRRTRAWRHCILKRGWRSVRPSRAAQGAEGRGSA
jgi:hypothetical protein